MFPWEIMRDELPGKYEKFLACLSGPSFAIEVAQGKPTNVINLYAAFHCFRVSKL